MSESWLQRNKTPSSSRTEMHERRKQEATVLWKGHVVESRQPLWGFHEDGKLLASSVFHQKTGLYDKPNSVWLQPINSCLECLWKAPQYRRTTPGCLCSWFVFTAQAKQIRCYNPVIWDTWGEKHLHPNEPEIKAGRPENWNLRLVSRLKWPCSLWNVYLHVRFITEFISRR